VLIKNHIIFMSLITDVVILLLNLNFEIKSGPSG